MRREVDLAITETALLNVRESAGLYSALFDDGALADDVLTTLAMGTWMTLLAYTEFYTDEVLDMLFNAASSSAEDGYRYLLEREMKRALSSWESRKVAFRKLFDIRVTEYASWQVFEAAIWVRNGIAHGSGGLSRLQRPEEAQKALPLDVSLRDGRFVLGSRSVNACSEACSAFVLSLGRDARMAVGP